MRDFDQLVNDIFNRINRKDHLYIIKATKNSFTSALYAVDAGNIVYLNETVEIFKEFSKAIQQVLWDTGILIIYSNDQNKPATKLIQLYNPELFTTDLFELTIYQEFGFQPKENERQEILKKSLFKEKIKETLVYACYENNSEKILETLKKAKKSELDKKLQYIGTPLGLCAENNNLACFKAIAEAGANVGMKSLAFTPLQLAFKYSSEIVKYIYTNFQTVFDKEIEKQGFYIAADSTDIDILNFVKELGHNLQKFDRAFPHLHNFTDRNNLVGIEFCLNNGLDINMKDKQGRSALDKAIVRNHKEAIDLLRTKGALE